MINETRRINVNGILIEYEGEDAGIGYLFASKAAIQILIGPFSGHVIDRVGYDWPMMFGLTVMFFSTLMFAVGDTYSMLFIARALQVTRLEKRKFCPVFATTNTNLSHLGRWLGLCRHWWFINDRG